MDVYIEEDNMPFYIKMLKYLFRDQITLLSYFIYNPLAFCDSDSTLTF